MCIVIHAALVIVNILMHSERFNAPIFKYSMSFGGMMVYVYLIISVSYVNYTTPAPATKTTSIVTGCVVTWFRIEMAVFFGIVFSNFAFMILRGIFKNKVDPSKYIDENKKLPNIDTLLALHEIGTAFHTEFVPWFVSTVLYFNKNGQ